MFDNILPKYITVKNIVFFVISILFIVILTKISEVAIMFFASFVIACSLEPLVKRLSTKMKRPAACAVALSLFLLVIVLFFTGTIMLGGNEIMEFAHSLPSHVENIKNTIISSVIWKNTDLAQIDMGGLISSASGITTKLIEEVIHAGRNIGSGLVYFIVSIIIVYYFMVDKEKIKETILKCFPKQMRKRTEEIIDTISRKSGGYVVAQIVTIVSVGLLVFIGLLLVGSEYAFLLGLITGVFDIVPVIGPTFAFLICMIVLYKYGATAMIMAAIVFAVAQLIENNFIRPYIFGKFLDLHPLIIYLFIFIAAKYMGVIGIIFAPAIAATTVVLIEEIYMKSLE